MSLPNRRRTPSASAAATSPLTAVCAAISSAGTPSWWVFISSVYTTTPPPRTALAPGTRLHLRLRARLGASRWHLATHSGNLLPLVREEREISFLVFDGAPATLRLERRHPRSDVVREVREVRVEVGPGRSAVTRRRSA